MSLKKVIEENWAKSKFISLSLNKDKVNQIIESTSFLTEVYSKVPLRTRAYVIINDITKDSLPRCICNSYCAINITYPEKGFRKYCGAGCSRKSEKIDQNTLTILDNYDFLYNERIINQKSIEQIAKELAVSTTPVIRNLKKHNLYQLNDGRRRNTKANILLTDRQKLLELYKTNTLEQISQTVGTSKATVSRWFEFHKIQTKPSNFYERKIKKISNEEQTLFNYIKSIYPKELYQSNRSILNGKEIDIYIPDKNIAIEYNGLYSHCYKPWEEKDSLIKDINYHLNKTIECEKKGIQLLQFYSDEWLFKKNIIENIIKSKLQLNKKIYARKCSITELHHRFKNEFLNKYHLQGEDKSSVKLGLIYENNLVAVMTFAKSRFNPYYDWELTRYGVIGGISITGGFSKLLSVFKKSYNGSIISYADRRYSNGNVYLKNGFKLIHTNKPSYYYVDKNFLRRVNRMRFQKKYIGAYDCTEYEKAREMGFEKIFDCGTLAFGLQ